jgi:phage portal protein BeeE
MAQVPLKLMRESATPRAARVLPAKTIRSTTCSRASPNPWQTSFEFRRRCPGTSSSRQLLRLQERAARAILELIPLEPGEVKVKRADDYTLTYDVRSQERARADVPGRGDLARARPQLERLDGMDWLQAAREAIGLAMATEESQAALHKNGVRPAGAWSVEGKLKAEASTSAARVDRARARRRRETAGKPMILDRAAKWLRRR